MNSKILPFNKTLIKKDWKLIGWLSYIVAALLFIDIPMNNIRAVNWISSVMKNVESGITYSQDYINHVKTYDFISQFEFYYDPIQSSLLLLFPITIAVILIGEERRKRTFEFLSVAPFTKYEIFFNKIIAGFIAILVPYISNGFFMYAMRYFNEYIKDGYTSTDVSNWLIASVVISGAIFAVGILFGTLTGSSIWQMILSGIFLIFPPAFAEIAIENLRLWGNLQNVTFDELGNFLDPLSPPLYAIDNVIFRGRFSYNIMGLLIFSIILIFLSKVLFEKNKFERNGEILIFKDSELYLKFILALCSMLFAGPTLHIIISSVSGRNIFVLVTGYVIGASLGWLIPDYLIKRQGKVA